jgi:hypothetical protein
MGKGWGGGLPDSKVQGRQRLFLQCPLATERGTRSRRAGVREVRKHNASHPALLHQLQLSPRRQRLPVLMKTENDKRRK